MAKQADRWTTRWKQKVAMDPWIKEIENLVKELVPDAPHSLIRKRTDALRSWLEDALDGRAEPRPLSVYDGVVLVAGPTRLKKRIARSHKHDSWLDILVDKAPLMDDTERLDQIADERGL